MIITNKFVTIKNNIDGIPKEEDFELVTRCINTCSIEPGSNLVLVKCIQISVDPYQLNRMKSYSSSQHVKDTTTKLVHGEPIDGYGVGRVVVSGHNGFQKDDLVTGLLSWAQYALIKDVKYITKLDLMGFPLSYHLGVFGLSGFTAYVGLFEIGKVKKGDKILVSTASGSVGNLVGQYAKLLGCYVIGCAGSKQKVDLLKDKLGFDNAFDYTKEDDLELALKRYFPKGIDIYFDNVGGEMLQAAIANMNNFGRVVACGVMSQITKHVSTNVSLDMTNIIYKRITIQGFVVIDYKNDEVYSKFVSRTSSALNSGQIKVLETIYYDLESIPSTFVGLFYGRNVGKTIVQLVEY